MYKRTSHILVVDDMSIIRKLLRKSLEFHGFHEIVEARDGASGWEAINKAEQPFDVVICDWEMPRSSGLDLLKRINSRASLSSFPVIIMVSEAEVDGPMLALTAGATGVLIKPFTNDSVLLALKNAYVKTHGAA